MKKPETPPDEGERIASLHALRILDSEAEERFDRYTRLVKRLFDVPIALVTLVDLERQWFKSNQGLNAQQTSRDVSFCGHAIMSDEIFVVEDTHLDARFADNPLVLDDPSIRFYAGFPLPDANGHRLGTLCIIDRTPRVFTQDDRGALKDIGDMVVGELASLQLATTDQLTGLSNRRGLKIFASHPLAHAKRHGQKSSMVMIDLDGFKSINDEFGHGSGDEALKGFASVLLSTFRDSDVIARIGGDEFCVLLTGTDRVEATAAVDRLYEAVGEWNNSTKTRGFHLSFSAGVASAESGPDSVALLLGEADKRMYSEKRSKPDWARGSSATHQAIADKDAGT